MSYFDQKACASLPAKREGSPADPVQADIRELHVHVYIGHQRVWRSFSLFDAEETVFGLKNLFGWSVMKWNCWSVSDICLYDERGHEVRCAIDDAVPLHPGENFYMQVDDGSRARQQAYNVAAGALPEIIGRQRSRSPRRGGGRGGDAVA